MTNLNSSNSYLDQLSRLITEGDNIYENRKVSPGKIVDNRKSMYGLGEPTRTPDIVYVDS